MGKEINSVSVEDDDDEPEEDERVDEVYDYAEKHSPEETAAFIRKVASQGPATIGGSIFTDQNFFSAYFLMMGTLDEEEPLPPQVKDKQDFFKAWATDAAAQEGLMACFEYFVTKKQPDSVEAFEGVLKPLWELDIIPEEVMKEWCANENVCRQYGVSEEDALAVRESAQPFLDWLSEGQ